MHLLSFKGYGQAAAGRMDFHHQFICFCKSNGLSGPVVAKRRQSKMCSSGRSQRALHKFGELLGGREACFSCIKNLPRSNCLGYATHQLGKLLAFKRHHGPRPAARESEVSVEMQWCNQQQLHSTIQQVATLMAQACSKPPLTAHLQLPRSRHGIQQLPPEGRSVITASKRKLPCFLVQLTH